MERKIPTMKIDLLFGFHGGGCEGEQQKKSSDFYLTYWKISSNKLMGFCLFLLIFEAILLCLYYVMYTGQIYIGDPTDGVLVHFSNDIYKDIRILCIYNTVQSIFIISDWPYFML